MRRIVRGNESFNIPEDFYDKAASFAESFKPISVEDENASWSIGIFIGDRKRCNSSISSIPGLMCLYKKDINPKYSIFFAPYYKNENDFTVIDYRAEKALASDELFPYEEKNAARHLLIPIKGHDHEDMFEWRPRRRWNRNNIFKFDSNKNSFVKESISKSLYETNALQLAKGDPEGLALIFSTKIRDLPAKVIDPIMEKFNEKMTEAGVEPIHAIDMPLISFLGKKDIISIDGRAVIPIEIKKTSKPQENQELQIEYLDLVDMQIKDDSIKMLKEKIEQVILDKQKIKQLSINALIKDRNNFIEKLKSSKKPSQGGLPAVIFMINKLDSELNSRIASNKLQISNLIKKQKKYISNPLLIEIEQKSDLEMQKPYGSSPLYQHPVEYLKSILRNMHYNGKLRSIMDDLKSGRLQKKYNPDNNPKLVPVFDALIEFGEELLRRHKENDNKNRAKTDERKSNFDSGVSELPVISEIEKLKPFDLTDLPIETKGLTPNMYKSDNSRRAMSSEAIKSIRLNLRELEETKERIANIRFVILNISNQAGLNQKTLSSSSMKNNINKIERLFGQLQGFVTKYRRSLYKSDGTIDKTKIGSSIDPIANINICDYIILLNSKVNAVLSNYNQKTANSYYKMKKAQADAAPPAAPPVGGSPAGGPTGLGGAPGAPAAGAAAGELKQPDIDDEGDELEQLREAFDDIIGKHKSSKNHHSRNYFDVADDPDDDEGEVKGWVADAVWEAIRRTGSRRALHQIDIALAPDPDYPEYEPPFIRGISGPDLGVALPQKNEKPQI